MGMPEAQQGGSSVKGLKMDRNFLEDDLLKT
jgi:hypothetical protein